MEKQYAKVVCAGMDVHHKFSNVTLRDAEGNVVLREKIKHQDREGLRWWLSQWPKGLEVALEASFGWAWLSDEMLKVGLRPRLSNCFKVEKMREARGWPKTNKKDGGLISLLPLETTNWWEVWLAPLEVRDQREWMRYRSELVGVQTQTKNRIHAIFHRRGIFHESSDLFGGQGRLFLVQLYRDGGGTPWALALAALVVLLLAAEYACMAIAAARHLRLRMSDISWLLVLIVLGFSLAGGPAANPQYRVPIAPLLNIAAAVGLTMIAARLAARRRARQRRRVDGRPADHRRVQVREHADAQRAAGHATLRPRDPGRAFRRPGACAARAPARRRPPRNRARRGSPRPRRRSGRPFPR